MRKRLGIAYPGSVSLNLEMGERDLADYFDVFLRCNTGVISILIADEVWEELTFHTAPINPDIKPHTNHSQHLLDCPSKAMDEPPLRQLTQPVPQQPLKVVSRGPHMQKERELNFDRDVELGFKVLELRFLDGEEEPVVVEADFAEGDDVAGCFGGEGKVFEGREEGAGAPGIAVEVLCGAGVDADGCVAEAD